MRRMMTGTYFEDLSVGDKFLTPSRTLSETDMVTFNNLTWDTVPLHTDVEFVKTYPPIQKYNFRERLVPSSFLIGVCAGLETLVTELHFGRGLAMLGIEAKFFAPVYPGDTVYSEIEILMVRESKSNPEAGIVQYVHYLYNQDDVLVANVTRTNFHERRPAAAPVE